MIRLKVDNSGKGLTPLNTKWWKPTKEEWVPVLLDAHPQFWRKQVDPTYQRPWARLTPRYAIWKSQNYPDQPILRATGLMQDVAYIYTQGNVFKVKTTPYGKYHQYGTSKMAARPWMGVPDISLKQIVPIAWRNILSRRK
jgi:phage gpG-like protein